MSSHRIGTDLLQLADIGRSSRGSGGGAGTSRSSSTCNGGGTGVMLGQQNLLRLALKRPTEWQWELTTSSSSTNIHFPRIQLYDGASGELMAEVDRSDCVIRSADPDNEQEAQVPAVVGRGSCRRSRTTIAKERLATSSDSLTDIFDQLRRKGLGHKLSTSGSQYQMLQKSQSTSVAVAPKQPQPAPQPDCTISRRRSRRRSAASRSSSILGSISDIYGQSRSSNSGSSSSNSNSTISCSMVQEVMMEQQKQKKKKERYRKSLKASPSSVTAAATPPAILILSPEKVVTSATHGVTIEEVVEEPQPSEPEPTAKTATPKIYKLVRSNAGTLMVREESIHTQRSIRRRQLHQQQAGLPQISPISAPGVPATSVLGYREPSWYEPTISHIDRLLAQVMLRSQDVAEVDRPSRIDSPLGSHRERRRRRSASATTTGYTISPVRRSTPLGPPVRRSSSSSPVPYTAVGAPLVRRSRTYHQRRRYSSKNPASAGLHGRSYGV
ncbi:serine/arginine repetitive matrix protein 1-like [Anopheles albimanus]|uniref:serine/arginine repetitive matrix protein 1-like n=1 Tax=Anopheles albimanus TaxID=7167 RepID=UPI00163E3542|nr:serine/arginine repetitive matrix protein 1-like [Anopheles albimanus]